MQIVSTPARTARTWSFILACVAGTGNLALIMVDSLSSAHVVTVTQIAVANGIIAFAIGIARMVQQNIAFATEEDKRDAITAVAAQPVKEA